ncbi:MAG: putative arabinose efflux permease, family [Gammaproteobacteria bacterium]|jgi:MFS family permease|nr:putative arabinose efflux permease, family [Gammaproteobacteria bacterium]
MNSTEQRATFGLATIFAFRMLGLFMVLPVFSLYAPQLKGATPGLIGMAIGIYGLTQALLQIPFGTLSDYWGRKPIIVMGLAIFALGSIIAALSDTIWGVMIGRALQGTGAVGSTIIAFVADSTREENRTKAMGFIGLIIGFSFTLAMVLGPILNTWLQVPGIFWLTALLAISAILILYTVVPNPTKLLFHADNEARPGQILTVLKNKQLLGLNLGIFFQHAILTAIFIVIPIILTQSFHLPTGKQWIIYLPILLLSLFITVPLIIISEKKRLLKPLLVATVGIIIISQLSLALFNHSLTALWLSLLFFFSAFNFLEACLPSLVSKLAPLQNRGTAMGIYSSSQFLGIFFGGVIGGWLYGQFHIGGVFTGCGIIALCWLLAVLRMQKIPYLTTRIFKLDDAGLLPSDILLAKLKNTQGIAEVAFDQQAMVVYLKVDTCKITDEQLRTLLSGEKHG